VHITHIEFEKNRLNFSGMCFIAPNVKDYIQGTYRGVHQMLKTRYEELDISYFRNTSNLFYFDR
jgi:hypothetical protein